MAGVRPDTFAGVWGRTKPYVLLRARILVVFGIRSSVINSSTQKLGRNEILFRKQVIYTPCSCLFFRLGCLICCRSVHFGSNHKGLSQA